MPNLVTRENDGAVAHLVLNRPDKLNALTVQLFQELRQHIEDLATDSTAGCVVIRGAGRCFSAGHDLADISTGEIVPSPAWHSETLRMMERLPQPVIAAVHGHCYTGALEVALAADLIIASTDARFGDTHAKWALTPVWGMSQRLPRRVGIATAKKLMFTACTIKADEAMRIGLCEEVFPADGFLDALKGLTKSIVANSAFSHAAYKRLIDDTDGMPIDAGLAHEVYRSEGTGDDMEQRIAEFFSR